MLCFFESILFFLLFQLSKLLLLQLFFVLLEHNLRLLLQRCLAATEVLYEALHSLQLFVQLFFLKLHVRILTLIRRILDLVQKLRLHLNQQTLGVLIRERTGCHLITTINDIGSFCLRSHHHELLLQRLLSFGVLEQVGGLGHFVILRVATRKL